MRNYAFAACIFAILAGCGKNRGTIPAPTEGPGEVLSKPAPPAPAVDSVFVRGGFTRYQARRATREESARGTYLRRNRYHRPYG